MSWPRCSELRRTVARDPGSWPTEFSSRAERGAGHTSAGQATTKPSMAAINLARDKKYATQGPGVSREGVKKPLIRCPSRSAMGSHFNRLAEGKSMISIMCRVPITITTITADNGQYNTMRTSLYPTWNMRNGEHFYCVKWSVLR